MFKAGMLAVGLLATTATVLYGMHNEMNMVNVALAASIIGNLTQALSGAK